MSPTIKIASANEFNTLLKTSNVVITDFYADWCGPCKAIAPTFESLSTKYSKPKSISFAKIDVDSQQQIAQQYGVSAMPTFMIFRSGKPINTIKGADPRALTNAVEAAIKFAPASKPLYSTPGRTLGGPGIKPAQSLSRPASASVQEFFAALTAFFGLYFVTLFSFDSYAAGENSQFNIHRVPPPRTTSTSGGAKATVPPMGKVGTISGLTGRAERLVDVYGV